MEIKWDPEMVKAVSCIYAYYRNELGLKSANKFLSGIIKCAKNISLHPNIGKIEPAISDDNHRYRVLIVYKRYRLV